MPKEQSYFNTILAGLGLRESWVVNRYTDEDLPIRKAFFKLEKLNLLYKEFKFTDAIVFTPTNKAIKLFRDLKTNKERLAMFKKVDSESL